MMRTASCAVESSMPTLATIRAISSSIRALRWRQRLTAGCSRQRQGPARVPVVGRDAAPITAALALRAAAAREGRCFSRDTAMTNVDNVLAGIDADLDDSLERLFALLRIKSISADPHYKEDCREAAHWCAATLSEIGIPASVRDTIGHPMVVGHYRRRRRGRAAPPLLRPLRRAAGRSAVALGARSLRSGGRRGERREAHRRARRRGRQGPVHDLRRGGARLDGGRRAGCRSTSRCCSRARRNRRARAWSRS